jgi:putative ABC transport system permease protein
VEQQTAENIAAGMNPDEAHRSALAQFGGLEYIKEETRDARGTQLIGSLVQDVRFALRMLRKSPGFTVVAVLTLALGIGATTAVFSVVDAALISPYPYRDASRIVQFMVVDKTGSVSWASVNGSQLQEVRQAKLAEDLVAGENWELTTTRGGVPENIKTVFITPNATTFFGMHPLLGRGLIPSDAPPGQPPQAVVVLADSFWRHEFGGNPDVIGKTLEMDHKDYKIIGVMPRRFGLFDVADAFVPLQITGSPNQPLWVSLRLNKGVSLQAADAELQSLLVQFVKETPAHFPQSARADLLRIVDRYGGLGHTLYLLFASAALLLLIGCTNVAILLLARGALRQHELAVRVALGANRTRILRQLLTESVMLSLAGAALGLLFVYGATGVIANWLPEYSDLSITINLPVLCFCIIVALVTGMLFGLSPALRCSRSDTGQIIQLGTRGITVGVRARRTHESLIAGQVALTLLLLSAAGVAGEGFLRLVHVKLGYDPQNVLPVWVPIHSNAHLGWAGRAAYFDQLRSKVAAIPGVISASISSQSTPPENGWPEKCEIVGATANRQRELLLNLVSPEYFSVLRIPLLQGRIWNEAETVRGARVAVVNQTMARQFWPGADPLGREILMPDLKNNPPLRFVPPGANQPFQIIGVVADARDDGLENPVKPAVYAPYTAYLGVEPEILVRTSGPPLSFLQAVQLQVSATDPNQAVDGGVSLEQMLTLQPEWREQRLITILFAVFAFVALALAAVGLYSVVSYSVTRRTREFGIRMALGAQSASVLWLVIREGTRAVFLGIAIGIIGAFGLSRFASSVLYGISATAPLTFIAVAILLILVALAACYLPARRAMRVDPMVALRYE